MARKPAGEKAGKGAGKKKGDEKPVDNVVPLNGAKGAPASDRTVTSKHNGPEASELTVLRHAETLRDLKKAIVDARIEVSRRVGAYRNARKLAKDEGVKMAILDEVMKEQNTPPEELRAKHNTTQTYRQYFKMPIGTQIPLFPDDDAGEITIEKVIERNRSEGEQAALRGENAKTNPHDPNGDAGRAWAEGWEAGQATLRNALGKGTGEKTNAAKEAARQRAADF